MSTLVRRRRLLTLGRAMTKSENEDRQKKEDEEEEEGGGEHVNLFREYIITSFATHRLYIYITFL